MENYEIVKEYLETCPGDITVKELLEIICNAECEHEDNIKKIEEEMLKDVGKVYFYRDEDDCVPSLMTREVFKIKDVKDVNGCLMYITDVLELADGSIFYMHDTYLPESMIVQCKEIDSLVFDSLMEKYNELQSVNF